MSKRAPWPPHVKSNGGYDRVWIPAQPGSPGYWMRLGRTGSPEALKAFQRLLAEMPVPTMARPPGRLVRKGLSVASVCNLFELHYRDLRRTGDAVNRITIALTAVVELYGALPAGEFRGPQLKALQRAWASKGLSRTYIVGLVGAVRQAWRHAVAEDLVPAEAYQALLAVRGLEPGEAGCAEPREVEPADPALVATTLPFLRPPVAAMVRVQLLTGMRPGELCRLTPGQIHRAGVVRVVGRGVVDLAKLAGVWVYAPATHKTAHLGYGRYVAIGPQAQAALAPWLAGRPADRPVFSPREDWARQLGERAANRTTKISPSHVLRRERAALRIRGGTRGTRYTVRGYRRAVERACADNGLPHWHPHQLRHAAEVAVEVAFDLDAARATLGHRDARVTARYGVRDVLRAAEVAAKIG